MDSEIVSAVAYAAGSDSHTVLAKGFVGYSRVYVLALADQIIAEYDCVTASEKSTAQLAVRYIQEYNATPVAS